MGMPISREQSIANAVFNAFKNDPGLARRFATAAADYARPSNEGGGTPGTYPTKQQELTGYVELVANSIDQPPEADSAEAFVYGVALLINKYPGLRLELTSPTASPLDSLVREFLETSAEGNMNVSPFVDYRSVLIGHQPYKRETDYGVAD